mmetsp:Transcript_13854/g.13438  ORF Transcript_13854/g.13438 Transcript_13854/m.13438 type:complete len:221 (-) Transcript_13854:80-742(-)|eukprot:CAMPEP_0197832996 /NCGR_PEP_ID=MMETSP1437-20131217/17226_1 /TAXON_ID=49252 ORGANISM="Eucampia antarctica, Strain CCMP1452" /NCGR_SAMPLE_ID=MMETSP1437 /ASSEMBLY_ACC=CAM_ASM_001096 /LENGTH=220 /DNA_ID=CAMNT_0043436715 /DNA_START=67 /DNA_END=729 /DNA_ORIENTATION=+
MTYFPRRESSIFLILLVIFISIPQFLAVCNTENDLDFGNCDLENLSIDALKAICERMGLDVDEHLFPLMKSTSGSLLVQTDHTHSDYVLAAAECLEIEFRMEDMLEENPEVEAELQRSLLAEDHVLLTETITEIMEQSPDLFDSLEEEIMTADPALYEELELRLEDGETFLDRPDIFAEMVAVKLSRDPDLFDRLYEDDASGMRDDIEATSTLYMKSEEL